MSDMTIQGLRFRRVALSNDSVAGEVKARQLCDADIEAVETPDRVRARACVANRAMMTNLWPHGAKLIAKRQAAPLFERYELLATLFAELAKMERAVEARPERRRRRAL